MLLNNWGEDPRLFFFGRQPISGRRWGLEGLANLAMNQDELSFVLDLGRIPAMFG
jgi:hypothetical protein